MPKTLTNLQANPVALEDVDIIGAYVQGGHGTESDYYNPRTDTILPGEPIEIYGKLCFSKKIILPDDFGTVVHDCIMDFMLDPDIVADTLQNALVYFDYDLGDDGLATNVQPTNGYLLGYAMAVNLKPAGVNGSGVPYAAKIGSRRILVKCVSAITKYGTVPDFDS